MNTGGAVQVATGGEQLQWPQEKQEALIAPVPMPVLDPSVVMLPKKEEAPMAASGPLIPERAQRLADGSYRLPLFYPVTLKIGHPDGTVRDEIYDALILKRLKGKQMRLFQGATLEQMPIKMLQASTGLDDFRVDRLYDEMDNADIKLANRVVSFFIKGGQETGQ